MTNAGRSIAIVLGGQFVQFAFAIVTSTLIGRALGPDDYGLVNLMRNGYMIVLTVSPLGLDASLLKYLASGDPGDPRKAEVVTKLRTLAFAVSACFWTIVAGAASLGLVSALYPLPNIDALTVVTFLALPFATDAAILNAKYRADGRIERYALLVTYSQSAFRIVAIPLALWLAPSVAIVVWINSAQIALSACLLWLDRLARGPHDPTSARQNRNDDCANPDFFRVLGESGWMCVSILVYSLMRSVDLMFLGAYVPARELAAYSALAMVSMLITIFPMAASQTLGPRISSGFSSGNIDAVKRELDGYLVQAAPVSAFIFGGVVAFGPRLDLVFGSGFIFDPVVCFLLPLGQVLSATLAPMGYALSMTGQHRSENAILLAGSLLLVLSCALFVPSYGARAAASSVAACFLAVNIFRFALVARVIRAVPGRLKDLASAPLALAIAVICAAASARLGPLDITTTFLACVVYTLAFGAIALAWLAPTHVRHAVLARVCAATGWPRRSA